MDHFIEPYAKENNILQLSLFYFGKGRPKQTAVQWKDDSAEYQLSCVSKYGVPGSLEQDVYTACMRIWVKQGIENSSIKVNYSEIARELNLNPVKDWVGHIKNALKKLGQARYEFTQCFFQSTEDGLKKINTHFSLFDTASLFSHENGKSKKKSQSRLTFPEEIKKNLEANYYQYLDMVWYRALPEGLPRRLYEYLEKRRYHNKGGYFTVGEEIICRWLPVTTKHVTHKRKVLNKTAMALVEGGYLEEYSFDKKKKQCVFKYAKKGPPPGRTVDRPPIQKQLFEDVKIPINSGSEVDQYEAALEWIRTVRYFRTTYLKKIQDLPRDSVIETFPHVRSMWDKGKIDKPGGVYKAFMESWRDQGVLAEKETQMAQEKQEKAKEIEEAYQVIHEKFLAPLEEEKIKEEKELEDITRKKKEEKEAKEEETARRKRENHKMEIMAYIATTGKENLSLLGGNILECNSQGIIIEKGGEELFITYGNVMIGVNLK